MVVFPKQICKRFLPDAGESRSNKTFFLKTNMELEVCTSLGSMFHRRGALFVNEIRPANDAGWNGRKSPCCRPRVLCWCSWKLSFSRSNAGADCWWQRRIVVNSWRDQRCDKSVSFWPKSATTRTRHWMWVPLFSAFLSIGSAEALPILCVRCALCVCVCVCVWERERYRERERERERERRKWRHLSSAEISDEFCTFPCQKFAHCGQKRSRKMGKWLEFEQQRSSEGQNYLHTTPDTILHKKWTAGKLCVRLRSGDKHHLRKSADRKAQIR